MPRLDRTAATLALLSALSSGACTAKERAPVASSGGTGASAGNASGGTSGSGAQGGLGGAPGDCPAFADAETTGNLESVELTEASGIVASRKHAGVLWLHNDSGDSARVFAASTTGKHLGTFTLAAVQAVDWEDIAIGPGPTPNADYLYLGDIGDNAAQRPEIRVNRLLEPMVSSGQSPVTVSISDVETFVLSYEDGAHDAETLLVDPVSGELLIVTKQAVGPSLVFRAGPLPSGGGSVTLTQTTSLAFGVSPLLGSNLTTAGDISASGAFIAIRSYTHAFLWRRGPGQSVSAALGGEPCPIPLLLQPQGESLGFAGDGQGYYTVSEGTGPPLHFYARE